MSKFFTLLFVLFVSVDAMEWVSYEEGLNIQAKSGKTIMLDVVRTECHFCNDMEAEVFENREMSKWLSEKFIAVKVNLDKDKIPLGIKIHFTPSFFFIDKEHKIVKKIPGAWNIQDFKDLTKGIK